MIQDETDIEGELRTYFKRTSEATPPLAGVSIKANGGRRWGAALWASGLVAAVVVAVTFGVQMMKSDEPPTAGQPASAAVEESKPVTNVGAALIGAWRPVRLADAPVSAATGWDAEPLLTFLPDGTFRAYDGCNEAHGPYAADAEGSLKFRSTAARAVECENFRHPIFTTTHAQIEGTTLRLLGTDGQELAEYERLP